VGGCRRLSLPASPERSSGLSRPGRSAASDGPIAAEPGTVSVAARQEKRSAPIRQRERSILSARSARAATAIQRLRVRSAHDVHRSFQTGKAATGVPQAIALHHHQPTFGQLGNRRRRRSSNSASFLSRSSISDEMHVGKRRPSRVQSRNRPGDDLRSRQISFRKASMFLLDRRDPRTERGYKKCASPSDQC